MTATFFEKATIRVLRDTIHKELATVHLIFIEGKFSIDEIRELLTISEAKSLAEKALLNAAESGFLVSPYSKLSLGYRYIEKIESDRMSELIEIASAMALGDYVMFMETIEPTDSSTLTNDFFQLVYLINEQVPELTKLKFKNEQDNKESIHFSVEEFRITVMWQTFKKTMRQVASVILTQYERERLETILSVAGEEINV